MRTFLCLLCRRPALTLRKRRGGRTECNCMVPSIARSSIGLQASGCWWQIAFSNALIASEETRTIITPITLHRRRLTYYLRAEKKLRDQNLGRPWKRTQKKYSTESWEIAGNSWTVCWGWTLRSIFTSLDYFYLLRYYMWMRVRFFKHPPKSYVLNVCWFLVHRWLTLRTCEGNLTSKSRDNRSVRRAAAAAAKSIISEFTNELSGRTGKRSRWI